MLCTECQKRPATLHYTQIINGEKTEVHVCEVCAQKKGYSFPGDEPYTLHDLLTGLFNVTSPGLDVKEDNFFNQFNELTCDHCQLSFSEFQRIGKFGCANCYDTFKAKLPAIFRKVHSGNTKHDGKIPKRKGGNLHIKKEIERYREYLQQLIKEENFEEAAVIRDRIKDLEKLQGGNES